MRGFWKVILVGAGLAASGVASAQSWGFYFGTRNAYPDYRYRQGREDAFMQAVCSGQRARLLEDRLRHEVDEQEIDYDDADRIHDAIDRLEDRQRDECSEGDRRGIASIAGRYDRIAQWIDDAAHGRSQRDW